MMEDYQSNSRKFKRVSTRNTVFQHLEVLKNNRSKRTKFKEVLVEGVTPINRCIDHHIPIKQVFFSNEKSLSQWARSLIAEQPQAEVYSVSAELFCEISGKDDPSEVLIVVQQPEYHVEQMQLDRVVVVDRPSNPGNLGSIVRSCNSFGIDAAFISGHGVDPYDAKSISASRGTVFCTPVIKLAANSQLEKFFARGKQNTKFLIYGSSAKADKNLRMSEKSSRFALIIGNEATGMTPYLKELSDVMLRIPISGDATSLNVACAASILLYELTHTGAESLAQKGG